MIRIGLVLLLFSATAAFAQSGCPVCEPAGKLREELRKIDPDAADQKARGEALGREGLPLLAGFGDSLPPPKQGRRPFEALIQLSLYAAPFTPDNAYEKALAAINLKSPDYRKRYQAAVRKGMRARDRRESCRVRYLQTSVSVQECKLEQAAKGGSPADAARLCNASYSLSECLAKK